MPGSVRRTCPACQRRYAGLVDPDCPVCQGIGVLALGAPALSITTPAAAARAVELYLEASARRARDQLPITGLIDAVEQAVDEARTAGLLADRFESGTPAHRRGDDQATTLDELDAVRLARQTGAEVTARDALALDGHARAHLDQARPRPGALPVLSAAGYRSQLARTTDPIHPLDSVAALAGAHRADDHTAAVLAGAAETVITRRLRKARP